MVLFHHTFSANVAAGGRIGRFAGDVIHFGLFGVDLFFVLSGFLITGILLDTRADASFFKTFYCRRILRIFPLYYGVLFCLLALTPLLHFNWQGMRILLLLNLQNLRPSTMSNLNIAPNLGLFHFWSLALEEQFYLMWPSAVFYIRDRRKLFLTTVGLAVASMTIRLILIATSTGSVALIHMTTICRADSLLLGGLIAMAYRSDYWAGALRLAPLGFFLSLGVFAISVLLLRANEDPYLTAALHPSLPIFWLRGLRYTVLAVGFGALIVWSFRPSSVVQFVFKQSILRFLGKYSYGIYVLHVPICTLVLFPAREFLRSLTHSKGVAVAGAGAFGITLSVAVAVVCFHVLENPFLRLKRFFEYESKVSP